MLFKVAQYCCLFILAMVVSISCLDEPDISETPRIEYLSTSKDTVDQSTAFEITFFFEDGNGDLDFRDGADTCKPSIFFRDLRPGQEDFSNRFCMPDFPDDDRVLQGEATIKLLTCCILPDEEPCRPISNTVYDTLQYALTIEDREGNISNEVIIPAIIMRCN